ncbi:MAG: DUF3000 domain-containing protein [Propionibacteriaceae bacterium]|nr:DUF3000 domain-containing protein [Propionibacteriaceae bacterium]
MNRWNDDSNFAMIAAAVRDFQWRPEVRAYEITSPQKIAPYAVAFEAEVTTPVNDLAASGRLVVLHNPAGDNAWDGSTRIVSYTQADVDFDMANDPLLPDVAWSWLIDALRHAGVEHTGTSGTVTTMTSHSFGELETKPDSAEVEIRCSWTVVDEKAMSQHVEAWQELLCQLAGLEPLIDGVIAFSPRIQGRP